MNVRTQQTLGGHTGKLHTAIVATLQALASFLDGHPFLSFQNIYFLRVALDEFLHIWGVMFSI